VRQGGKPGNVDLVGVMRKLVLGQNAVARRDTPLIEERAPAP